MICRPLLLAFVAATFPVALAGQSRQLVDLGGHRLDVLRAGTSGPTVVLEAGLGGELDDWAPVIPGTSQFGMVVAYSRAGFGTSEAGSQEHTARNAAIELHALLARLQVKQPIVLVGRSYGGILVRLYTSLYPAEVAGMVIVDGSHEQQVQRWGMLDSTYPAAFRTLFEAQAKSATNPADASETRESLRIQAAGAVEGMTPLPDIPIAVLTSMKVDPAATYVNGTARGHDAWRAMHDEWFRRSRNGIHIVTTRSGHAIQRDEPDLVVQAIRFVVDRVKVP